MQLTNYFREELLQMRKNYNVAPMKDIDLSCPQWLTLRDPMYELLLKKQILLQQGEIVYASIVQANSILFHYLPPSDCPAHIIYSRDPYFIEHPDALSSEAYKVFCYKGRSPSAVPDAYKEVARVVTDELDRSDFTITLNIDGRDLECYMIPTMIYRKLLPKRKLCGNLLPILTVPDCKQVMVLPKQYWSDSFKKYWKKGAL